MYEILAEMVRIFALIAVDVLRWTRCYACYALLKQQVVTGSIPSTVRDRQEVGQFERTSIDCTISMGLASGGETYRLTAWIHFLDTSSFST